MDTELPNQRDEMVPGRPPLGRRLARSWFAIVFALMLAIPSVSQLTGIDNPDPLLENRALAPEPAMPRTGAELLAFPSTLNAWLQDWFGFRQLMVRINNRARYVLFHEVTSPNLLVGKHGRVFLTSHPGGPPFSLVYQVCGAGYEEGTFLGAAISLQRMVDRAVVDSPSLLVLFAPTAVAEYPEDLPGWAWAPCRGKLLTVDHALTKLADRPDILDRVVYPVGTLQGYKTLYGLIPRHNIHWAGEGPLRYIERLCEQRLGLARALNLPLRTEDWPSDLNRLNPGLGFANRIPWPDPLPLGVTRCFGNECPPLDPDPKVTTPLDRYRALNPNGKKLLIFGDSFADNIAADFIEYFGDVWHVHYNELQPLSRQELDRLYQLAFRDFHPDQVIFVINDFGIFFVPELTKDYFWPDPPKFPIGFGQAARRQ